MDKAENLNQPERSRIDFSQDKDVIYWTEKFKVNMAQLYEAAKEAGSSVNKIKEILLRKGYLIQDQSKPTSFDIENDPLFN